jgi:hypothetical protein
VLHVFGDGWVIFIILKPSLSRRNDFSAESYQTEIEELERKAERKQAMRGGGQSAP